MMKINSLKELRMLKKEINKEGEQKLQLIRNDVEIIKANLRPGVLFSKALLAIVPEPLRKTVLVKGPVHFIARILFHDDFPEKNQGPQTKGRQLSNTAVNVIQRSVSDLVFRFIKRKF